MANELVIQGIEQGSRLLGRMVRSWILKPADAKPQIETKVDKPITTTPQPVHKTEEKGNEVLLPTISPAVLKPFNPSQGSDTDYRFECITKHLGAASVLLREAHERAITNKAVTDDVSEKVMAALAEHAGADDDFKPMLNNPEVTDIVNRLMDGIRQFRRGAWDSKITVGGGTVTDIADARMWNDMLLQEAWAQAKKHAGTTCVASGM